MKILLAAGIFFPDVGGPAIHVEKIAERLSKEGYQITVVAYGDDQLETKFPYRVRRVSRKYHSVIQWLLYSMLVFREGIGSKLIYAFDPTAAGLPACLASIILRKSFFIRVGGDPIWEREVETGKRFMSIDKYYQEGFYKIDKPVLYRLIRTMLKFSDVVVFYNKFWKEFYIQYFGLNESKIHVIKNPVFKRENGDENLSNDPVILFAGRFVAYKNLPLVISAFEKVRAKLGKGKLLLVGKGPDETALKLLCSSSSAKDNISFISSLPQAELFSLIKSSAVCIGPALSEFNPNFILEALSFGRPVILSRGNGLSVELPQKFLFDPMSVEELVEKIEYFFDAENFANAVREINEMDLNNPWEKVTDSHLELIKCVIK